MGKTSYATGDAETQKLWNEDLFRDIQKETYFERMTSTDGSKIVHEKTDLMKKKGDSIAFFLRYRGQRAFLPSGTPIEGNEGSLATAGETVVIDEKCFGIRDAGMINRQRPIYEMDSETRRAILEDGAEAIDLEHFTALAKTNTDIYYPVAGVFTTTTTLATAKAAITAADIITPEFITSAKTVALTDRDTGRVPLRPIMIDGKPHLVLLVHPYQLADLKKDATYAQANREAMNRGQDNPIFTGAVGVWDGVIVHEHENITKEVASGSIYYGKGFLMGAQALVSAWAMKPEIREEKFSYGQEHGYGFVSMWGVQKPQFTKPGESTAKDYGSVVIATACTNLK